jgi:hypothetical protein
MVFADLKNGFVFRRIFGGAESCDRGAVGAWLSRCSGWRATAQTRRVSGGPRDGARPTFFGETLPEARRGRAQERLGLRRRPLVLARWVNRREVARAWVDANEPGAARPTP